MAIIESFNMTAWLSVMPDDPFYKTAEWKRLRNSVVKHSGYKCSKCNANVQGKGKARVDHIKPKRTHPHLAMERTNMRVLCVDCDAKRHREKGGAKLKPEIGSDGWPVS